MEKSIIGKSKEAVKSWKNWDLAISNWIRNNLHSQNLSRVLSKINRGEILGAILIPSIIIIFWNREGLESPYFIIIFLMVFAYSTDRSVLALKKFFSRKRPLVQVMGKQDANPDMKHSFPSAHSANSMVVLFLLVFIFKCSPWIFVLSLLAGIGRLLTLHHFVSDVLGGWIVGILWGGIGFWSYSALKGFY